MTRFDRCALACALSVFLFGAMLGTFLGLQLDSRKGELSVKVYRDTVTVYDTVRLDHFREVTKKVVDTMWVRLPASEKSPSDSVLLDFAKVSNITAASKDTAIKEILNPIQDSLLVGLPFEQVTIKDSLFTAQISGYKPSLDWISIVAPTKYITVETRTKTPQGRWSIGATAGLGAVYNQNGLQCGPGVVVGVQYRF